MHYGPMSYYVLGATVPRTQLRLPYPRRRRPSPISAAASTPVVLTRRTAVLSVSYTVPDGTRFRVRVQQTDGTTNPTLIQNASSFNITK